MFVDPHSSSKTGRFLSIAVVLVVGLLLGTLGAYWIFRNSTFEPWNRIWSVLTGSNQNIDLSQPTVVNRIQQLHRLETVQYTMDKIVSGEKNSPLLPDFLAGDRLLLLVHGEVVAGIDFGNLQGGDVTVKRKEVWLHLPDASVFTTRLDSAKTRVYSRQTGLLVPTDPNLETQVRQEAERVIQESALADGILGTAQENARSTITSLLRALGFEKVNFH